MKKQMQPHPVSVKDSHEIIPQLIILSASGLEKMYDREKRLFCYRAYKSSGNELVMSGSSIRYTMIALMGIHLLKGTGMNVSIDTRSVVDSLFEKKAEIVGIGDLGLFIWLVSLSCPDKLEDIWSAFDVMHTLDSDRDAREGKTTELSWFLTGISQAALALGDGPDRLQTHAVHCYRKIIQNYGGRGIFGHQGLSLHSGAIRRSIGCFADQVYPIYAFCKFAQAFQREDALKIAAECGKKIRELQGPLGQWWWYYDSARGETSSGYPVYSVHQDGMAPMALLELQHSTDLNFGDSIARSLQWILGNNERNYNMVSEEHSLIWRCIEFGGRRRDLDLIKSLFRIKPRTNTGQLSILFECRPYHLGWLLYAFADHLPRASSQSSSYRSLKKDSAS